MTATTPMGGSVTRAAGLDFGAVMAVGTALGIDVQLLAAVLPDVETAMIGGSEGLDGDDPG